MKMQSKPRVSTQIEKIMMKKALNKQLLVKTVHTFMGAQLFFNFKSFNFNLSFRTVVGSLLLYCGSLASVSAFALASDASQPIRLVADKATFNEKTGITTYVGHVVISQGSFQMMAKSLVVNLDNNRRIASAVAIGNPATMQQKIDGNKGMAKGQAQKIEYNANSGVITLLGNARLNQAGASIAGNSIRYSLKVGDFEAKGQGSQRVELVFPPSMNNRQAIK